MKRISFTLAAALLAILGLMSASHLTRKVSAQSGNRPEGAGAPEIIRHSMNPHNTSFALTTGSTTPTSAISYHGGQLMQTPTVYLIWYGNWNRGNGTDTPSGQQIVRDFASNIGGSPYFLINSSYSTGPYTITGSVLFTAGDFATTGGNEATDAYSQGTRLRDASVLSIVNNAINTGHLPYDANGVYFVLTSSDVNEQSGFCTQYCGWHTAGTATRGHVRYSFVGNAARCLNACAAQSVSPNGNAGVDAMISVI
ncbi:MAG: EXORDIUM family protein, partial [Acidobacteriota bacterium]|nr:EXORDIUM family protein [Acidobacteriota bacterium]